MQVVVVSVQVVDALVQVVVASNLVVAALPEVVAALPEVVFALTEFVDFVDVVVASFCFLLLECWIVNLLFDFVPLARPTPVYYCLYDLR